MFDYNDAVAFLDTRADYIRTGRVTDPSLDKIRRLMELSGDPQASYPVIHVTGTNGKGSVTQMITRLLAAQGLSVGTVTSPHLHRPNERMTLDARPIDDDEFAQQIEAVSRIEAAAGLRASYFELTVAAAYRWFSDIAVDAAVVEVGMLGRWDATNIADGQIAVVTNVDWDHAQFAGDSLLAIATEKAGIVKPGSTLVLGVTQPELQVPFRAGGAIEVIGRDEEFGCEVNELALGGRLVDLRTPTTIYPGVFVPLHGRHQGDNAAVALAAAEAFFGQPLSMEVVAEAFAAVNWPGRFEVLGHQPLVIVDGAHNPHGADACAGVFSSDFDPAGRRILVVGFLSSQDPTAMLSALRADEADLVICCTPPTARAVPADVTARAARRLGCDKVVVVTDIAAACDRAIDGADGDDAVLVTGSLYVVGEARAHLRKRIS